MKRQTLIALLAMLTLDLPACAPTRPHALATLPEDDPAATVSPPVIALSVSPPEQPSPRLPRADVPDELREAMVAHRAEVRQCYTRELRNDPALRGRMVVEFRVGTDGSTGDVRVREDTVHSRRVRECVTHTVAALRFAPASSPSAKIRFPLVFESHE